MPHYPKPFYRTARKAWFLQVGKQQINLGPDQVQAFRRYHELMQEDRKPASTDCRLLVELIDEFLDSVQKNQAADTYEWYRSRLQRFAERYPELAIGELKPFHVQRWLDSIDGVKSGTKRNYARSIIRVMLAAGSRSCSRIHCGGVRWFSRQALSKMSFVRTIWIEGQAFSLSGNSGKVVDAAGMVEQQ